MKFFNCIMILAASLALSCDNDDNVYSKIPSTVLNAHWVRFPNATEVDFNKAGDNYEVEFEVGGLDAGAYISPQGIVLKEKKEIPVEELPATVKNAINKFGENKIRNAEVIKTKEEIFYQAQVKRFWINKKVVLDKTGKESSAISYWD